MNGSRSPAPDSFAPATPPYLPQGVDQDADALAARIDAILPQTQCTKCGFDGCRPYAEAIAAGQAPIDRCPPGGSAGIAKLAALLGRAPVPLDPSCGSEGPLRVAHIDPSLCIGCTRCISACPVDAIIGAARRMHTVAEAMCSGCDLCVPACPVDCIVMIPPRAREARWTDEDAQAARQRFERRRSRLEAERSENERRLERYAPRTAPRTASGTASGIASQPGVPQAFMPDPRAQPPAADATHPPERCSQPTGGSAGAPPGAGDPDARRRALIDAAVRRARERLAAVGR